MQYALFTVKGLENTVKNELVNIVNAPEIDTFSKLLVLNYSGQPDLLTSLRTVDDIAVVFSLTKESFEFAVSHLATFRPINKKFSITTSIVGTSVYQEQVITELIAFCTNLGYEYTQNDRTNLDIRIFINDKVKLYGVRLTIEPLYKRLYDTTPYLGALKSTIAAAMIFETLSSNTSSNKPPVKVVDSFCGSGTILCEAFLKGLDPYGGDISPEAVRITRSRFLKLGNTKPSNVQVQNAVKTKWNASFFDIGVSNLPWDKQHKVESITDLYAGALIEWQRIMKQSFKLCVICHKPDLFIKLAKRTFGNLTTRRIDIGYLGQNPSILILEL